MTFFPKILRNQIYSVGFWNQVKKEMLQKKYYFKLLSKSFGERPSQPLRQVSFNDVAPKTGCEDG